LDNVAYIGDDDNDLECMRAASLAGCPADASENVIKEADFVSARCGGCGAVREFIEWIVGLR
jgi:3-deoxy-D-manno-octulosonate 8-phosphate phosphatase (KDO 8-P phosphatase)